MLNLDLRTVALLSGFMSLLASVVLYSLYRSYPPHIRGLREWALAPLVLLLAAILVMRPGGQAEQVSLVFANLLLVFGNSLFLLGLQLFYQERPAIRLLVGLALLDLALVGWFTYGQDEFGARVATTAAVNLIISGLALRQLWRHDKQSFAARFLMLLLLLRCIALGVRVGAIGGDSVGGGPFDATPVQTLYLTMNAMTLLALMLGLILLASTRLNRELDHMARHDVLTGALSRRAIVEACERELDRCHRHHRDMALLMLDIDHFKAINDAGGHLVGDEVIRDFVVRVFSVQRRSDQLGRYGGEEFLVLLPETGPQEALTVADRIRSRVATLHLSLPAYTVSIGVTVNLPGEDSIDMLLKRADEALYRAKAAGRNRVVMG